LKLEYHPYKTILQFNLVYRATLETCHQVQCSYTVDVMPHA